MTSMIHMTNREFDFTVEDSLVNCGAAISGKDEGNYTFGRVRGGVAMAVWRLLCLSAGVLPGSFSLLRYLSRHSRTFDFRGMRIVPCQAALKP